VVKLSLDLSITIADVEFKNPIIIASGPPTMSPKHIIKCIRAGAAGAVTKTITYDVTQQIQPKPRMYIVNSKDALKNRFYSFYSIDLMSEYKPEAWIKLLKMTKKEIGKQNGVLIASIAGRNFGEWEKLAQLAEKGNADMIELNLSCPHIEEGELMGRAAVSDLNIVKQIIRTVKDSTSLPVIGKLTPHGANPVELAKTMVSAGVDAIVSTARFQGLILDVDTMRPILWGGFGGYGGPWQAPISIGWTAHIAKETLRVPIIGSGGISTWKDAISFMLVGASAIQLCTTVMIKGYNVIQNIIEGIKKWMKEKGFKRINEFTGLALKNIIPVEKLERRRIYKVVIDDVKCTGCGICIKVCPYEALKLSENNKALVDKMICDNCGLCVSICPLDAISLERQTK